MGLDIAQDIVSVSLGCISMGQKGIFHRISQLAFRLVFSYQKYNIIFLKQQR